MKNPRPFRQSPLAVLVLVIVLATNSIAFAQKKTAEKKENTSEKKELSVKKSQDEEPESLLGVLLEYFTVDHRTANRLTRAHAPKAADAKELRDELEQLIDQGSAELRETVWLSVREGERARNQSSREIIYPTEFAPPSIPNVYESSPNAKMGDSKQQKDTVQQTAAEHTGGSSRVPMTHAAPTSFETRHAGVNLEIDPFFGEKKKIVHIPLVHEIVTHLGFEYFTRDDRKDTAYGIDHMRMPLFHTMRHLGSLTVVLGNENLLAIHTPPDDPDSRVLVMLRVDLIPVQ